MKKKEFQAILSNILESINDVPDNADVMIQYLDLNTNKSSKYTIENFSADVHFDDMYGISVDSSNCENLKVYFFDNV